jgi:hypothetical protein
MLLIIRKHNVRDVELTSWSGAGPEIDEAEPRKLILKRIYDSIALIPASLWDFAAIRYD